MIRMQKMLFALLLCSVSFSKAHAQIDVQHYDFNLLLSDASDTLQGTATINIRFTQATDRFFLNLTSIRHGRGMQVLSVQEGAQTLSITHTHDTLWIASSNAFEKGSLHQIVVRYNGVPSDGLIISKNRWRNRTFFGDNWPNRAQQWLPCNDRPDDKATVAFTVAAPSTYKVISNGVLISKTNLGNNQTRTSWRELKLIPTKVMVVGVANFAVKSFADSSVVPVSAWVFPQDSSAVFRDYALATQALRFLNDYIGPFPFEKLANVQSTTIFGGMENASCIFYDERLAKGDGSMEAIIAHEIAHQWFGDAATEKSFAHLWLSEGFATYMSHLYLEKKYGGDTLKNRLRDDRQKIVRFVRQWPFPVVDSVSALMNLLNANSYEKGSWVLHMLRRQVGDSVFQKIIRTYYSNYKYRNADTWDFEKVADSVSGKNLQPFFQQWLFTPGVPQLQLRWKWADGRLSVTVQQQQHQPFVFPLTIGLMNSDQPVMLTFNITKATETFSVPLAAKPTGVVLDPDVNLLFDGTVSESN